MAELVTVFLNSRSCIEYVPIVYDFALEFPHLRSDDLSGMDSSLELGHNSVRFEKMIPLCVDLVFNKEEQPDTAILLKSAPHLPCQYYLIAHIFVDFRTGLQNRLGHRREIAVKEVGIAIRVHLVCQRSGPLQVQKHEYAELPTRVVVATGYVPQEHAGSKQPVKLYEEEKESDKPECFNHPDKGLMP